MFYPLIHPFHRQQIILQESRNFLRRHIMAAFWEILISSQQVEEEKKAEAEKKSQRKKGCTLNGCEV